MKVRHLKVGWKSKHFEVDVQNMIDGVKRNYDWRYHDIKVSSSSNDCLLIFKEKGEK